MAQFFNSIKEVSKNYSKYDAWEQEQADKRAQKEYLQKNIELSPDKVELTKKKAETVIRATELMDARSEDNCQNMEQWTGMVSMIPLTLLTVFQKPVEAYFVTKSENKYNKKIEELKNSIANVKDEAKLFKVQGEINALHSKSYKKSVKITQKVSIGFLLAMLGSAIGMILWGNSKQKEASRIGRYQAKQNELQGLENFIVYTPEQLEKCKEIAKTIPDEKTREGIIQMIRELKALSRDKYAYKEWLAQKDPNEIEKLKQLTLSPEEFVKANEDRELIVNVVKDINIKAEEYSENVENAFDTIDAVSWLLAVPIGLGVNKILKSLKVGVSSNGRAGISMAVSVLTPLGILLASTIEEKKAARIGRYKARQDLLENPANLMVYSDEDMKKAEQVKAPEQKQGFFAKLGNSFAFLKTYIKDKSEYNKYKKTQQKENEKIQKALKDIETTDAQKEDAKKLQKNVFRAFDEIDEMSQRYSEDVEAACDISKQMASTIWSLGTITAAALSMVSISKGKFPITKLANWITNLSFKEESSIRKAINGFYDTLKKQDKSVMQNFQKELVRGNIDEFLKKPENKVVKDAMQPIIEELNKLELDVAGQKLSGNTDGINDILGIVLKKHLKETRLAKWTRSMITQITKLITRSKFHNAADSHLMAKSIKKNGNLNEFFENLNLSAGQKLAVQSMFETKEIKSLEEKSKDLKISEIEAEINKFIEKIDEELNLNITYKNYKTIFNTSIAAAVPVLGVVLGIPYAFNAWLTNIQKKSGKIGIMKAMDKIDDPRVFGG